MENRDINHPVRILIVDDHPNTATMLARVLSRFDTPVEVLTASSGEDALSKIGDKVVDILITDFMMPGMNGLELIEKFTAEQKPAHTILITAYDTPGLAITARRLSIQDYLVKPVQPEKIRAIVTKVLEEMRPPHTPALTTVAAPAAQTYKILIADDYPDNLRLLSARLQSEGYTFIPAWDGEEALQKTRTESPDLVLLDVNMPKKDGFQVLAEMRSDPEISHIPVIIITAARIGPKDVREGLTLGADDYVIKPFDWRELAARIQSKLRVKRAEDVLRRRTRELGILPEIGRELSARLDLEDLAQIVLGRTVETLGAIAGRLDVFQLDGSVFSRMRYVPSAPSPESPVSAAAATAEAVNAATASAASGVLDRTAARLIPIEETREQVVAKGIVARVLTARQGLIIEDITTDERWYSSTGDIIQGEKVASAVVAPLLGRQSEIGVLTLLHSQTGFFTQDHLGLLQAIASQAAIAIENAQLFSVEHKRAQDLMALNQITREINRFTYFRQLLEDLPELIRESLGYSLVTVWNGGAAGALQNGELELTSKAGSLQDLGEMLGIASQQPDTAALMEILTAAPRQAAVSAATVMQSAPQKTPSVIAAPVLSAQAVRAVLAVYSPYPAAFQEGDRILLETLATQVTSALERIGLFESIEREQRRLLAVLRSAADAILVIDGQTRLTLANPAGERLFVEQPTGDQPGRSAESWVGQPLPSGQGGYNELIQLLDRVRQSGTAAALTAQQQGEVHWPDGRTFSASVTPIEEGGQVAVLHDISHLKALSELKNEYIATASHDLKNPIMSLIGYNDLLTKAGPLNEMQTDFSRRINSAAMQMRDLVLNLLEVSRIESGMVMQREPVSIHPLLFEATQEQGDQAQTKGHTLTSQFCDASPRVNGDRTLLQQMLHNLLSNAIKYTPAGGQITLRTWLEDNQIAIQFQDTGVGIPPEDLPHVFGKFFRSRTEATRDIEGTGLGLSIVQSIVENHGGRVAVESKEGEGSTFTVHLPVCQI